MRPPRVLFVLQNAWRRGWPAGKPWHSTSWANALWRSYTGRRLCEMIPVDADVFVCNGSPQVADNRRMFYLPDPCYVRRRVQETHPDYVLLLGKQAAKLEPLMRELGQAYGVAPHPAWRALTKQRTREIRLAVSLALEEAGCYAVRD